MKFLLILTFTLLLFPFVAQAVDCSVYPSYVDKLLCVLDKIGFVLYVIGGGIALVVLIYGGVTYMTSGGNEEKQKQAKKIISNGLIGAAIVFLSGFILDLLAEFIAPLLPGAGGPGS